MNVPEDMTRIVGGRRYNVATAELLADDCYWDGSNFERHGRNTFLYRTPNGAYFTVRLTQWQGERDELLPCTEDEAVELYETALPEHARSYESAFPGRAVEEA